LFLQKGKEMIAKMLHILRKIFGVHDRCKKQNRLFSNDRLRHFIDSLYSMLRTSSTRRSIEKLGEDHELTNTETWLKVQAYAVMLYNGRTIEENTFYFELHRMILTSTMSTCIRNLLEKHEIRPVISSPPDKEQKEEHPCQPTLQDEKG